MSTVYFSYNFFKCKRKKKNYTITLTAPRICPKKKKKSKIMAFGIHFQLSFTKNE